MNIFDKAIFAGGRAGEGGLFPQVVKLSEQFFDQLTAHPVPLDEAAVRAISNNSMALDLYAWLSYRLHALKGVTPVLHTWGQNLLHHPHIHFLVPGGGIAPDGQSWIACRPGFFLPVRVLSRMFRGLFLHYLEKAFTAGELNFFSVHRHLHEPAAFRRYLAPAWNADWVIYAKRPFVGPAQVLDYVGRYTHRVAISNNRLVSMDDGKVCFR